MVHGEATVLKLPFPHLLPILKPCAHWAMADTNDETPPSVSLTRKHKVHCHQTWSHTPWLLIKSDSHDCSPLLQICTGPRQGGGLESLYHCPYFRNDLDAMVLFPETTLIAYENKHVHTCIHTCTCLTQKTTASQSNPTINGLATVFLLSHQTQ